MSAGVTFRASHLPRSHVKFRLIHTLICITRRSLWLATKRLFNLLIKFKWQYRIISVRCSLCPPRECMFITINIELRVAHYRVSSKTKAIKPAYVPMTTYISFLSCGAILRIFVVSKRIHPTVSNNRARTSGRIIKYTTKTRDPFSRRKLPRGPRKPGRARIHRPRTKETSLSALFLNRNSF